ncbi:lambda family phage portal protein [Ketogulonicigenium robustum]|uniref:Lambda family phage portal protein n=1 Tax=Ketogulonicigenium robustum TaxID=92947 RepID=A0A1W6NWG0_9RHOB|nr:phage portal protein [Ketogulonicigenium robustum]ARO13367.1 lambda family phage portal protein [Ketogulonicigenium robustum]
MMPFPFSMLKNIPRIFRRSGIEAGGGGRRWQGAPMLGAPTQSTLAARGPAMARASALYVNTPQGNRIVEAWTAALVGKGFHARSQHPDRNVAYQLNTTFELLANAHLPTIIRAMVRDGEAFVQLVTDPDGKLRLRQIPADQIDPSLTRDLGNGARIIAGIEFDGEEQVQAYHVLPEAPGTPFGMIGAPIRVPASDMLHLFDPLFPGQVRGLSWLSPVLLKLRDRDEASDALLMQLKVASLITGFVRDPEGGAAGFGESPDGSVNVSLEPGAMRILPPGAEVTFSQPGQGLQQAVDFLRGQDREIASGVGLTFEALTGDLERTNYSSARVGLLEFRRRAEMLQRNLIEARFLRPLWQRWIDAQVLAGVIPADPKELVDFRSARFVSPGWAWVDPQNEVAAEVAAIDARLKSREEVVAGRGRDIDDLDEELARDAQAGRAVQ